MIIESWDVSADDFHRSTGWEPKPEGLCRGEICVPAPGALRSDGSFDIRVAADRLGMPIVSDGEVSALGPATLSGRALATAVAADPELRTFDGRPFRLSSLRGKKVILLAWSSY